MHTRTWILLITLAFLPFLAFLAVGCGGGNSCSTCGSSSTPPPPPPPPAPTTVAWKTALPPAQSANILALVATGSTLFGAGVEANATGTDTSAYDASITDSGSTASAGTPVSRAETSDITGMVLLDPSTAFAVGKDMPSGNPAAVPAAFTVNPATGTFLSVKPFSCPAGSALSLVNATDATAVARDGSTSTMYVALKVQGDVPEIIKTDLAGNPDCTQAAVRIVDALANGTVHSLTVTTTSFIVGGEFSTTVQGFAVVIDRTSGQRVWESIISGTPVAGIVFDSSGAMYVGGTNEATAQRAWHIERYNPPFSGATINLAWSARGVAPSQAQTADTLVSLFLSSSGSVVAVGQTTPQGQTNVNNVETSIAVLDPATGATTKTVQVNVFSGDQEHVGAAILGPNNTVYVAGEKFTLPSANFGAWFAKINLP